jgi:hypothetical protein
MLTTLDLSSVTDRLLEILDSAVASSKLWVTNGGNVNQFNIQVSGLMPEAVRERGECQLTTYLFHVDYDPYSRNASIAPPGGQTNRMHPLALDLHYLVTAYAKDQPTQEQQAMSIALKALHERATYRDPADGFAFTITLTAESADDGNRRWQAYSTPFRLSAVCRVGVVYLTPESVTPAPAAPPRRLGLGVGPAPLPYQAGSALVATSTRVDFAPYPALPGDVITYDVTPAIVRPGDSFSLFGTELKTSTAKRLYLIDGAGVETEVTDWIVSAQTAEARLVVSLPANVGAAPAMCPAPGVYLFAVGSSVAAGDPFDHRSNSVPALLAPSLDAVPSPWLSAAGVYSFTGDGFVSGATQVYFGGVKLTAAADDSVPIPGEFSITASGTKIRFAPPNGFAAGAYPVRVIVNGVDGAVVGTVDLP